MLLMSVQLQLHVQVQMGEGGFAIVYLAEQTEPVKRRVALKIAVGRVASHVLAAVGDAKIRTTR